MEAMAMATTQTTQGVDERQRWLGLPEAARYTGISEQTLRRMVRGGKLRLYAPTERRRVVDRLELDALIQGSVATVES
jgi:excisionase family DNA binding protein